MVTTMHARLRRSDQGFTTIQVVTWLAISLVIIATISSLIFVVFRSQAVAADERSQTTAVQNALQEIARTIDESAGIFRATETELGVMRNVESEATTGGIDCRIDQFFVTGGDKLEHWTDVQTGACRDSHTWTDPATLGGATSAMVHYLEPFTLVDDEGLVTAACEGTEGAAGERGGDAGYCVPLFRYLDSSGAEFTPSDPVTKHSISAVRIVLSGAVEGNPVPVSRSKDVSPNNYMSDVSIGEVAAPMCPATLSRTLSADNSTVTLTWAPVPNATQYRIVRTAAGVTQTLDTISVAAMPSAANPSFTDDISTASATSFVYQVLPTVGGEEATGCPQTIVSLQVSAPNVDVTVSGSTGSQWQGARPNDTGFSTLPRIAASWSSVAGANGYEAELREINPGTHTPLSGWAPFDYSGGSVGSNVVQDLTVDTDMWDGDPLFSRAFQVRVRSLSNSGASLWTYCYMLPGSGVAGECGQFPGNSFPDTGRSGYLMMPAPGITEVTDVTRSYTGNNTALSWGTSPDWSAPQYNRETNDFFRVQRHQQNGVISTLSYTASDYSNVFSKTTSTSGSSSVNAGDWSNFRVLRCNYINPYATSGASLEQCGPSSRVWSALGLPSVPSVNVTVNSSANTNTVRWGKHSTTTTTDVTNQRINYYDVAEQQGGGNGTSQSSGNTTTAADAVTASKKSSPWQASTTSTSASHSRREGDFTRYSSRAGNKTINNAPTNSWLAGVTGEAGQGVGVTSWSDWSADTARNWQALAQPQCTVSDTWRSITITARFGDLYVSPLDRVLERELTRWNTTENVSWTHTSTANSNANWTRTWTDDGSSGDRAQGTVKPLTNYHGSVRITTQYASPGGHYHGACASGTVNSPPRPNAPSVSVSRHGFNTNNGHPIVRKTWSPASSGHSTAVIQGSNNGSGWRSTNRSGALTQESRWNVTERFSARGAHTQRLANWGFWGPTGSDSTTMTIPGGTGVCPTWFFGGGSTITGSVTIASSVTRSGNTCSYAGTANGMWDIDLYNYHWGQVNGFCNAAISGGMPNVPDYCANPDTRQDEALDRVAASTLTRTGDSVGRWSWSFGDAVGTHSGGGYRWSWYSGQPASPTGKSAPHLQAVYNMCGGAWSGGGYGSCIPPGSGSDTTPVYLTPNWWDFVRNL